MTTTDPTLGALPDPEVIEPDAAQPTSPDAYDQLTDAEVLWLGARNASLLAAAANVVMQLSILGVGRGVAESKVHSGRLDRHPIKRARTTLGYLAVALFGTDEDRQHLRSEVNRSHRPVRSEPGAQVAYNAFDQDLQLWVALCLAQGAIDVNEFVHGPLTRPQRERLVGLLAPLATTLQVQPARWPATLDDFEATWADGLARIEVDEVTARYLRNLIDLRWLPGPLGAVARPLSRLTAIGFVHPEFRALLDLPWSDRDQTRFERLRQVVSFTDRVLPEVVNTAVYRTMLWDFQRRRRKGIPFT